MPRYSIVGAKFRPPAIALLDTIQQGTALVARREPHNPADANALAVLVKASDIATALNDNAELNEEMDRRLADFGLSVEDILAKPEWHLGYIPRTDAASISPQMDLKGQRELTGQFTFSANGLAMIHIMDEE